MLRSVLGAIFCTVLLARILDIIRTVFVRQTIFWSMGWVIARATLWEELWAVAKLDILVVFWAVFWAKSLTICSLVLLAGIWSILFTELSTQTGTCRGLRSVYNGL